MTIGLGSSLSFLAGFLKVLIAMNLAIVTPIQAVYGGFGTDRVLTLQFSCVGVMNSYMLRIKTLDDGCE